MAKSMAVGAEPFDRLEEKIKLLVSTIGRLKGEHARLTDENGRLQREVEALQARVARADEVGAEASALKEERDVLRTRVTEILAELDALTL